MSVLCWFILKLFKKESTSGNWEKQTFRGQGESCSSFLLNAVLESCCALKHNTCSCLRAFLCTCSFLDSLLVLASWLSLGFYSNVTLSGFSQLPYLELKPSWTSSPIYTCIFSIPSLLYILPKHVLASSILNSLSVYHFYCLCLVSRL